MFGPMLKNQEVSLKLQKFGFSRQVGNQVTEDRPPTGQWRAAGAKGPLPFQTGPATTALASTQSAAEADGASLTLVLTPFRTQDRLRSLLSHSPHTLSCQPGPITSLSLPSSHHKGLWLPFSSGPLTSRNLPLLTCGGVTGTGWRVHPPHPAVPVSMRGCDDKPRTAAKSSL